MHGSMHCHNLCYIPKKESFTCHTLHVFTGAHSAEIASIAALTDAQLRSAIDLYDWKFAKKIMPVDIGPLSVAQQDSVCARLLDAWQLYRRGDFTTLKFLVVIALLLAIFLYHRPKW